MRLDGKKIKHALIDAELSQVELAKNTGVSVTTISLICSGKKCTKETAQKIADALGVKVEELTTN